ncbi:globin domain-containing protein [Acuticoccus sp. I52.16.1]|uniref:globin domain-containing protein n=1 Tax=Acuticoccus sp. I52.16.1 TaxID=2928472 RepID=UPI001FD26338|nr:globin domain-containing protein [Acuticoccus sp. I52.16.1]UOM37263.1 globin domain-containing protein [Acuticoccus sp. I52.16.1]
MALSDHEIDILRASMHIIRERKHIATEVFYERLFAHNPKLRRLFGTDIAGQTEKVMVALGAVVAQIHDLDACREMTADLAVRHVRYGVAAEDYTTVGLAVQDMLGVLLADDHSPEIATAWRRAYDAIAATMIATAYGEPEQVA